MKKANGKEQKPNLAAGAPVATGPAGMVKFSATEREVVAQLVAQAVVKRQRAQEAELAAREAEQTCRAVILSFAKGHGLRAENLQLAPDGSGVFVVEAQNDPALPAQRP